MGTVLERGGSNLAWWRLDHVPNGLGNAPPGNGGNCREKWGIVRNYDDPNVRAKTQDILDRLRVNQCWLRVNYYAWENSGTTTLTSIANGQVQPADLNRLSMFLQDVRDRDFKLNFAWMHIGDTSPQTWGGFQQARYNNIRDAILQVQPLVDSFGWAEQHTDLSNEMQAASNQSAGMRQFGWQIYRDFVNAFGPGKTGGVSVGFGLGPPGLSRYNIQFQDQQNLSGVGVSPILDIHGYIPLGSATTNWLKLLENAMVANGDTRNIRISETYYSSHTAHVTQLLANIAQLDRDVEHIIQWGLAETGYCDDVEIVDTVLFNYQGEPCGEVDCARSAWA